MQTARPGAAAHALGSRERGGSDLDALRRRLSRSRDGGGKPRPSRERGPITPGRVLKWVAIAVAVVYVTAMGAVARCQHCDSVLATFVESDSGRVWFGMPGISALEVSH